ncbi:cupin-like domain-containing protein [Phenylobacterium deserti]|uniref:Cupin-like domain-containing protein n=1 Tax=Phenylobacterium deserti TaxID=1914756 RepID=A0A328ABY2_9CAUL|nr:cupin-like domain-containing protein [Phenylobacterium deserti]RAK52161.1 cupin-like domain-containing protein [Phenylobacterium deserti]
MSAELRVRQVSNLDAERFRDEVQARYEPAVFRGLVADWPLVTAGRTSPQAVRDYLKPFDNGRPTEAFVQPAGLQGRFFYREDLSGFNFQRHAAQIGATLDRLVDLPEEDAPYSVYLGSTPVPQHLPGLEAQLPMPLLPETVAPRIWLGTASVVAAHYDMSDNIACVASGRRTFTLFPPDQVANLYVGPLENTVAGQPTSMVSPIAPDLEAFPRYAEALANAYTAELEPGDAIYIPPLWWHSVQSKGPLNVLVNYWWDPRPATSGSPFEALAHAIWTIGNLPPERREAWRAFFEHYVFRADGDPAAHLPPTRRGVLGPPSPELDGAFRHFLIRGLGGRPG